jgi:hypothetical protein
MTTTSAHNYQVILSCNDFTHLLKTDASLHQCPIHEACCLHTKLHNAIVVADFAAYSTRKQNAVMDASHFLSSSLFTKLKI